MSMQDSVSDLLTRIRNGHMAKKNIVSVPLSKVKKAVVEVLQQEGYIDSYTVEDIGNNKFLMNINLKYYKNAPVISKIQKVSKPSLRVYRASKDLPRVLGGLGVAIVSTTKGIMSDREARQLGQGGEVLCYVE